MTATTIVRFISLALGTSNIALALVALRHSHELAVTQPDAMIAHRVNRLAYLAILIAGVQAVGWQLTAVGRRAPLVWYSAPTLILWQGLLLVWFTKRISWHNHVVHPDEGINP